MSDSFRKDFGEQAKEKVTPDSQKSTGEVFTQNVTGATDKVAGAFQPDSDKSTFQKMGDYTRGDADQAQSDGSSYLDSAKGTASDMAGSISDTFSSAADTLTGKTQEMTN